MNSKTSDKITDQEKLKKKEQEGNYNKTWVEKRNEGIVKKRARSRSSSSKQQS